MQDEETPESMPTDAPVQGGLGIWRLGLAVAAQPLLQRRDLPFDPEAPVVSVPDALRYVDAARALLPGPLALEMEGPGDPLAAAADTLRILSLVADRHPDVRMGMVLDGPLFGEYVEELDEQRVSWVVLRFDAVRARTAERFIEGAIYKGEVLERGEAARLYVESLPHALSLAHRVGLPVVARCTLLPTINDEELEDLARLAARGGAGRFDVVAPPRSSVPGTRSMLQPTAGELLAARMTSRRAFLEAQPHDDGCAAVLEWLSPHRFRDVALASLEEYDGTAEFHVREDGDDPPIAQPVQRGVHLPRRRTQVVAVATQDGTLVDLPLGRARQVHLYAVGPETTRLLGTRTLPALPARPADGVGHVPAFLRALLGCKALVSTAFSARALEVLRGMGIRPVAHHGGVADVLDRVARGTI